MRRAKHKETFSHARRLLIGHSHWPEISLWHTFTQIVRRRHRMRPSTALRNHFLRGTIELLLLVALIVRAQIAYCSTLCGRARKKLHRGSFSATTGLVHCALRQIRRALWRMRCILARTLAPWM